MIRDNSYSENRERKNEDSRRSDAAANTERSQGNERENRNSDRRKENIRYASDRIDRLNDLYERGSI
jgi:hypothetical protein